MDEKWCSKCDETKPLTEFYMYRSWKGLTPSEPRPMSCCKKCHLDGCRQRYQEKRKVAH
jgi:hypothetical protein